MKKLILLLILSISSIFVSAQTKILKDQKGNYYVVKDTTKQSKVVTPTGQTFTDAKGNTYPVFKTVNNKLYIIRVSKNTGNEYKQYLKV